jgi:PGM1 C-terminal domain
VAAARERRSVVVVPSRTIDRWHEPPAEAQAYEERLLSSLFELCDPHLHMTYVTSSPIALSTIDYYLSLLPRKLRRSARGRLTLIALGDRSTRPLSEKLLERPRILERIRRSIPEPRRSHLVPYNVTVLERDLALALDVPLYGADPRHAHIGTKSGSRELFASTGIPHPLGVEHIGSAAEAIHAVARLRARKPIITELVMKLDAGVSGEGNALIDLTGLPEPGAGDELPRIRDRVAALTPQVSTVTVAEYLAKLATQGGVVEERITGRELRSPSVQFEVTPAGQVQLLSTHDQILGGPRGQQYLGCRFPADRSYAPEIAALGRRLAHRLAEVGVIGRFAIDFIVARTDGERWTPFAIELNLRVGGTTHPYQALAGLVGGDYDAASAVFTTAGGQQRHYVATDHLQDPQLRELGREGLLAMAEHSDLRFDRVRRVGTVFHMLSSLDELGRAGFTAIGQSAEEADALYDRVRATLISRAAAHGTGPVVGHALIAGAGYG